jgi:hypothetical protein
MNTHKPRLRVDGLLWCSRVKHCNRTHHTRDQNTAVSPASLNNPSKGEIVQNQQTPFLQWPSTRGSPMAKPQAQGARRVFQVVWCWLTRLSRSLLSKLMIIEDWFWGWAGQRWWDWWWKRVDCSRRLLVKECDFWMQRRQVGDCRQQDDWWMMWHGG